MNKRFFIAGLSTLILGIVFLSFNLQRTNQELKVLPAQTEMPSSTPEPRLDIYPDEALTPGDVFDVTGEQVCVKGYSSSVRDVSLKTKKLVYEEYGVSYPQSKGAYEVDHFIPLELGGSNDIKNLFLEPAEPRPGFHEKDVVENYLHDEVCKSRETLEKAQEEIRIDWYKVYKRIPRPDDYKF